MSEKVIMARRQLMVGKVTEKLKELHDKVPEAHEEILKLTKDICELIHPFDGTDEHSEKVNELYERITAKF